MVDRIWFVVKRLVLGITLILLASLVLLVSDWNRRKPAQANSLNTQKENPGTAGSSTQPLSKTWNVHILQYSESAPMEQVYSGALKGFEEAKLMDGRDIRITSRNAQGDIATLNNLVDAAISDNVDLIFTLSTPALQAAVNKVKGRPIVFSIAVDPKSWGAGKTNEDHLRNVTGVYVTVPVDKMMQTIREYVPDAHKIGTLFTPSETNSVFVKEQFVQAAERAGIEVITAPVASTSEVLDAAISLTARGIDIFCQLGDNVSSSSFPSIIEAARRARLPLFCFSTTHAKQGAILSIANDYFDNGREAALVAARVIRGEDPASIPYTGTQKVSMTINPEAARMIGFHLPESLLTKADLIVSKETTEDSHKSK